MRARSISSFSCGWISCIFIACLEAFTLKGSRMTRNPNATTHHTLRKRQPPAIAPHQGIPMEFTKEIKETTHVEGFPTIYRG